MRNIRIKFSKTDRAKYISHLDLNRFFQRSFKKSGVPVWYTEGFNPHIYLHFLTPLSLGTESISEFIDLKLTDDSISYENVKERINAVLPIGFKILSVSDRIIPAEEIGFCRYDILFEETDLDTVKSFLALPQITVLKKTKRKEYTVDMKEEMRDAVLTEKDGKPLLSLTLPAEENRFINPDLLISAFSEYTGNDSFCRVMKTGVLTLSGREFK